MNNLYHEWEADHRLAETRRATERRLLNHMEGGLVPRESLVVAFRRALGLKTPAPAPEDTTGAPHTPMKKAS